MNQNPSYQKPQLQLRDNYDLEEAAQFLRQLSKDQLNTTSTIGSNVRSETSSSGGSKIPVLRDCDVDVDRWHQYRRWSASLSQFKASKHKHLLLAICTTSVLWMGLGVLYVKSYEQNHPSSGGVAMCFDTVMGFPRFETATESILAPSSSSTAKLDCNVLLKGVFAQDCLVTKTGNVTAGIFAAAQGADGGLVGLGLAQGILSLYTFGDTTATFADPTQQQPPNGCQRPASFRQSSEWTTTLQGMTQYNAATSQINRVLWSVVGTNFCTLRKLSGAECDDSLQQVVNFYQPLAENDHEYLDLYSTNALC
jgi:hypothetical protein